jgi:hypothetical protein
MKLPIYNMWWYRWLDLFEHWRTGSWHQMRRWRWYTCTGNWHQRWRHYWQMGSGFPAANMFQNSGQLLMLPNSQFSIPMMNTSLSSSITLSSGYKSLPSESSLVVSTPHLPIVSRIWCQFLCSCDNVSATTVATCHHYVNYYSEFDCQGHL